jgi:hypothetical protein
LAAALVLLGIRTDLAGYFTPKPMISVLSDRQMYGTGYWYDTTVSVSNAGGRKLVFTAPQASPGNSYAYVLERRVDPNSWEPVSPRNVERPGSGGNRLTAVKPRESMKVQYRLSPGDYRFRVSSNNKEGKGIEEKIELAAQPLNISAAQPEPEPQVASVPPAMPGPSAPASSGPDVSKPPVPEPPKEKEASPGAAEPEPAAKTSASVNAGVAVELRGLITFANREPRFSFVVHQADGTTRTVDLTLGDPLYGAWVVNEYNPARQTVTIIDEDGRLLIVNRGRRVALD